MKLNKLIFELKENGQWGIGLYSADEKLSFEQAQKQLAQDDIELLDAILYLVDVLNDEVIEESKLDLQDLARQGYDFVFTSSSTSNHWKMDAFGNVRNLSQKEQIKAKMDNLEQLGRKLLKEEKYEEMQEAKEIYDKLKSDYDKL